MSADLDRLIEAASQVNVIDTAGRIIAHPRRHSPSATSAEVLALASAVEAFWAVCLEAELLVRAIRLPEDDAAAHAIAVQVDEITRLMAAIRGATEKEKS